MNKLFAVGVVATLVAGTATAGPWEDGVAAYKRGDYATAVALMEPLAEEGDAAAQYNLGITYARGLTGRKDYERSIKWFRRAADQGAALAQFNLGVIYQRGLGVPQDYAEAAKWYLAAANGEERRAQLEIGLKLASGQGIAEDLVQAHMWLNLAASLGEPNAAMHRDIVATRMTRAEIEEAEDLARNWAPPDLVH